MEDILFGSKFVDVLGTRIFRIHEWSHHDMKVKLFNSFERWKTQNVSISNNSGRAPAELGGSLTYQAHNYVISFDACQMWV